MTAHAIDYGHNLLPLFREQVAQRKLPRALAVSDARS
jgi:hypothetical protein